MAPQSVTERLEALDRSLRDERIPALVLSVGPDVAGATAEDLALIPVLVRPRHFRAARAILRVSAWRYELGGRGLWRLRRSVVYTYDAARPIALHSRLPLGLFPGRALRHLEAALWSGPGADAPGLHHPPLHALCVHLAVQCTRPRWLHHRSDWSQLQSIAGRQEDQAAGLADRLGVREALDRALKAAAAGDERPPAGPPFDGGVRRLGWRVGRRVQRALGERPAGQFLDGEIGVGEVPCRGRFAGIELTSAPPVFPPTPVTEGFVPLVTRHLAGRSRPVVVDVGTGCGPVALAIAVRWPDGEVHATEVSGAALRAARRNARRLGVRSLHLHRGSLLDPLPPELEARVDALAANLPYYPHERYVRSGAVARAAIEGTDADGLGLYRRLLADASTFLRPGGICVVQLFDWQWERLCAELPAGYRPLGSAGGERFTVGALEWIGSGAAIDSQIAARSAS